MPIITTAEYKSWMDLPDTTYDTQIAMLIPLAGAAIESVCGCTFEADTYTRVINGDDSQRLVMDVYGITSITSIKSSVDTSAPVTLESSTYTHDGERTIYRVGRDSGSRYGVDQYGRSISPTRPIEPRFERGWQNIEVVCVAGFDTDNMPQVLKHAAFRLIDHYFETRGNDIICTLNKTDSGSSVAMKTQAESNATVMDLLREYRMAM